VAFACILSMNPEVLVIDEPLAGLDQKTQQWLVDFLLGLKKAGKTLILSTHHDTLAHTLADRIVTMNEEHQIESILPNHTVLDIGKVQ
jgi:cobalt/nickel transport system ATP-binding protein